MAARSRFLAWSDLLTRLKGINGRTGGYWLDVGRRVYPKLVLPEDREGMALPYLCAPLIGTAPAWTQEGDWILCRWKQGIYGFASVKNQTIEDETSVTDVIHLAEDVIRAVMVKPYDLTGTCEDVALMDGGDEIAGVDLTDTYGEFSLFFQVSTRLQRSNLGPLGT